jgi:hypothetical protein
MRAMFSVRELAELGRQLDEVAFTRQMGPFALMQRPPPEERLGNAREHEHETRVHPAVRLRGVPTSVDFGDLIIATLPPPSADGSMQLLIGRSPDCDLVVHDPSVSKHHATVQWDGQGAVLEELGSVNGTYVNNHRMKDRWTLRDGDQLSFGDSHFLFLSTGSLHRRLRGLR